MSQKIGEKKEHFSIRKLSVGAASVLIGTSLYLGGQKPIAVHADSADAGTKTTEVQTDQSQPSQSGNKEVSSVSNEAKIKNAVAAKKETSVEANENKERVASEETKQKLVIKRANFKENDLQAQKDQVPKPKPDLTESKEQKPSLTRSEVIIDDALKDYTKPITVRRIINYTDQTGKTSTTTQEVTFGIFKAYLNQTNETGKTHSVPFVASFVEPKNGKFKVLDKKTLNGDDLAALTEELNNLKRQIDKESYQFADYQITPINGYYDKIVTQSDDPQAAAITEYDLTDIPALTVDRKSYDQIIDITFLAETPDQPTEPQQTTPAQPTIAPVHPENPQPSEPGTVKPKPEEPAAPSHHAGGHQTGTVKPKAQKKPSQVSLNKAARKANAKPAGTRVIKTAKTVAPKAQMPAKKINAKAALPKTGDNKSSSAAAILLGGAAVVIGLIVEYVNRSLILVNTHEIG